MRRREFLVRLERGDDKTQLNELFEYTNNLDDDDRAKLASIEVEWNRTTQHFLLYAVLVE